MLFRSLTDAPGSGSPNQGFAFPVDQIGVWTSTTCVIHCLLTPVVLSISAVSAHFLPLGKNASHPCSGHCRAWSHCTSEGIPQASLFARTGAHGCRPSLHFRWRVLGRSPSVTCGRGRRHFDRQRIHVRRTQKKSHLLPRLQLQPHGLKTAERCRCYSFLVVYGRRFLNSASEKSLVGQFESTGNSPSRVTRVAVARTLTALSNCEEQTYGNTH